jgi:hypothetical protein
MIIKFTFMLLHKFDGNTSFKDIPRLLPIILGTTWFKQIFWVDYA